MLLEERYCQLVEELDHARAAQRLHYDAGWSDMKASACHLLRMEGYDQLADMVDAIEKPPSGDKDNRY